VGGVTGYVAFVRSIFGWQAGFGNIRSAA